jgi:hypothetical protein
MDSFNPTHKHTVNIMCCGKHHLMLADVNFSFGLVYLPSVLIIKTKGKLTSALSGVSHST